MSQPEYILRAGTKVRTNAVLEPTTGILVNAQNIALRKPNADGEIRGVVGGHGVYWVQHDGDTFAAVYSFTEFELAPVPAAAEGWPPAGGGTATRAQLHAMRDLSIPFDLDHPPTFDDAARLIREAEEVENPMRVVMGPPVRDIREAMHPADDGAATFAGKLIAGALLWTPGVPVEQVETRDVRRGFIPIADVPPDVLADIDCPESPAGAHVHVDTPHVATLPDGSRINLPAGTVLREGEDGQAFEPTIIVKREPRPTCCEAASQCSALNWQPLVPSWQMTWGCVQCCPFCGVRLVPPGETAASPSTIEQARDLLRRARARLVDEPDAKKLDGEIVAFLRATRTPEGSR